MKTIFLKSTTTRPLFGSANKRPGVTRNGILTGAYEHRLRFFLLAHTRCIRSTENSRVVQ